MLVSKNENCFFLCQSCTENPWNRYFTYFWCIQECVLRAHAKAALNTAVISQSGNSSRLHIAYCTYYDAAAKRRARFVSLPFHVTLL
jgi:hypothetical protein